MDLQLRPAAGSYSSAIASPRVKRPPSPACVPVPFAYAPSDDGTDENLLILLHGLGDTHKPFAGLARQLKLPQTATLALRAPEQIPYLDTPAFQWYPSFDLLGELVERPNPTSALDLLEKLLAHLVAERGWPPARVHIFGFAQGGSVAAELAVKWWRAVLAEPELASGTSHAAAARALGSIVTVSGPLLSHPTLTTPCPTPILVFHRGTARAAGVASFQKGFADVHTARMDGAEGMPRAQAEWMPVMRFWSERLARRQVDGLYEVMSGTAG